MPVVIRSQIQSGYETGGAWFEVTPIVNANANGGVRFSGLPYPILIRSGSLTLTPTLILAEGTLNVAIQRLRVSSAFSSSNLPSGMTTQSLGSLALVAADLNIVKNVTLDLLILAALWNLDWAGAVNLVLASSDFDGRLSVSFSLTTDEQQLNEPSSVNWRGERSRWYLCPRCGVEVPITRVVEDEDRKGLMVCRKCRDQSGRRDIRWNGRKESEPRLWPRV